MSCDTDIGALQELMRIVDAVAATSEEFEELASAIEGCDIESLSDELREAAMKGGTRGLYRRRDHSPRWT